MTTRSFLHRLEYAAYQVVAGITQLLPLRALRAWGRAVGGVAYHLLGRRRRLTLDNLARALPELDPEERRRVARRCFAVQSATYHEQVWALRRGREIADRFEIVGREHFDAARARGKGVFVLTGHYGCWELAGYPLGRWLGTLYIVARPQNNPYIAAHFERLRESNGNVQIDRGRAGTRMLKVLKKGGAIGVAIDQRVRPSQALLVPFFGRYAWTSRLPAYLSTVTGCAAVPMVCEPLDDGSYRMTFDQPILPEGEGENEIERLTRRYAAALEPHIRARPELWLWMHTRWQRTRKQRRAEAIAKLDAEARLPPALPLQWIAERADHGSPLERLGQLATDAFVEDGRHLLLIASDDPQGCRASLAASAFGAAIVWLGHATRWFTIDELSQRLGAAQAARRLDADMRELDQIPLVLVSTAGPESLTETTADLLDRFLLHRFERGSVVLAGGASVAAWREAAARRGEAATGLTSFLGGCEAIDAAGDTPLHRSAEVVLPGDRETGPPDDVVADRDTEPGAVRA